MALSPNFNWLGYSAFIAVIGWPLVVAQVLMQRDLMAYTRTIFFTHDMTLSALSALVFFGILSVSGSAARVLAKEKQWVIQTQRCAQYSVVVLIMGLIFAFTILWVVKE